MTLYLADTSAWHRSGATPRVADRWETLLAEDELTLCAPIKLEILYSARGGDEYGMLAGILDLLPELPLDERASSAARRAQARLAERSQHRGPRTIDLLIAAVAEVHGAVLLHYDRNFDAIARATGQPVEWLARRGSLD
ncbi:MAG TPA: PIN domain-containing protein [Gaiellaceae bacterium]